VPMPTEDKDRAAGEDKHPDASRGPAADEQAGPKPAAEADTSGANPPAKDVETSAATAPVDRSQSPAGTAGEDAASSKAVTLGAVLLVLIVGGVLVSFAISKGGDEPAHGKRAAPAREAPPPASWKEGEQVDVELTVLPEDKENLACASTLDVAGRHCGFENATTPWSKPSEAGTDDDKHLLKPYATTGRERLLAAGLWSEPALAANLPPKRFSVKCKYTIEGRVKGPNIRWGKSGPWKQMGNDWFAGVLSGCTVSGS